MLKLITAEELNRYNHIKKKKPTLIAVMFANREDGLFMWLSRAELAAAVLHFPAGPLFANPPAADFK